MSTIRARTTPETSIPEISRALADEELLACAFQDAVQAMARYAIVGKTLFHATLLLDELREGVEKGNRP
jgi:hypothetical protein